MLNEDKMVSVHKKELFEMFIFKLIQWSKSKADSSIYNETHGIHV